MGWLFGRKRAHELDVDTLLTEANRASPPVTSSAAPAATDAPMPAGGGSFRMPVEDVFLITGRGVVATGRVESGTVTVGLEVQVVHDGRVIATAKVTGIEKFRATLESATVGDNVGLLLDGLTRQSLDPGDVLTG